jgi:hypothetical protein
MNKTNTNTKGNNMTQPITVGEMIELLKQFDANLPVQMSMNQEYQGRVRGNYLQVEEPYEGGTPYLLITDCPSAE